MRAFRSSFLAIAIFLAHLTGCGQPIPRRALTSSAPTTTAHRPPARHRPLPLKLRHMTPAQLVLLRAWFHGLAVQAWTDAYWRAIFTIPPDLVPVADCIKGVESGNYAEASHPSSGSGAYQYIPSTWAAWFARWRTSVPYVGPDYRYAYEAPPGVQDAVLTFTLRNGGAGNWSGVDGCTGH